MTVAATTLATSEKRSRGEKKKSVSFADSRGLDLELIHIISKANRIFIYTKENEPSQVRKQPPFADKKNELIMTQKVLVPEFILNPEDQYERLGRTGICLDSIEIYNHAFIRGVVFTMPPVGNNISHNSGHQRTRSNSLEESETSRAEIAGGLKKRSLLSKGLAKLLKLSTGYSGSDDMVYVIWSVNGWQSWECIEATRQKRLESADKDDLPVRMHEFFIYKLSSLLDVGQKLQMIICNRSDLNRMDEDVHEKKMSYSFKCGYKI
jgi:hypothetical protein